MDPLRCHWWCWDSCISMVPFFGGVKGCVFSIVLVFCCGLFLNFIKMASFMHAFWFLPFNLLHCWCLGLIFLRLKVFCYIFSFSHGLLTGRGITSSWVFYLFAPIKHVLRTYHNYGCRDPLHNWPRSCVQPNNIYHIRLSDDERVSLAGVCESIIDLSLLLGMWF